MLEGIIANTQFHIDLGQTLINKLISFAILFVNILSALTIVQFDQTGNEVHATKHALVSQRQIKQIRHPFLRWFYNHTGNKTFGYNHRRSDGGFYFETFCISLALRGSKLVIIRNPNSTYLRSEGNRKGGKALSKGFAIGSTLHLIALIVSADGHADLMIVQGQFTIHPKQVSSIEGYHNRLVFIKLCAPTPLLHFIGGIEVHVEHYFTSQVGRGQNFLFDINTCCTAQTAANAIAQAQRKGTQDSQTCTGRAALSLVLIDELHLTRHRNSGRSDPQIIHGYQQTNDDRRDEPLPMKQKHHLDFLKIEEGSTTLFRFHLKFGTI